ncbi:hypothetical protein AB0G02_36685 [Actinosynnema sp. NPDC023658]|uniref:hypothetical protein n=1 Tax=Actinosynnema sp. NPDC023658 TaxID=3155465 RepID=UPI0033CE58B0
MEFDRNAVYPSPQESGTQGSHPDSVGEQAPGAVHGPHTGFQGTPGYPAAQVPGYPTSDAPGYPTAGYPAAYPVSGVPQGHPTAIPAGQMPGYGHLGAYPAGQAPVGGYPVGYPAPPAPEGTSVLRALQASLVWAGVVLVVVFSLGGVPLSGYGLGTIVGRLLPISLASGLLVRLFVKRKRIAFGWLVLASLPTFIVSFVVIGALLLAGQQINR